jgi:hypothetical protein
VLWTKPLDSSLQNPTDSVETITRVQETKPFLFSICVLSSGFSSSWNNSRCLSFRRRKAHNFLSHCKCRSNSLLLAVSQVAAVVVLTSSSSNLVSRVFWKCGWKCEHCRQLLVSWWTHGVEWTPDGLASIVLIERARSMVAPRYVAQFGN